MRISANMGSFCVRLLTSVCTFFEAHDYTMCALCLASARGTKTSVYVGALSGVTNNRKSILFRHLKFVQCSGALQTMIIIKDR